MKKFNYFQNHGDEDGNNCWSVCYGEVGDSDHIVVGAEDRKGDAKEACRRLNAIIKDVAIDEHKNDIYQLETNLLDVPEMSKDEKAVYRIEIKNHKMRISEIKKGK